MNQFNNAGIMTDSEIQTLVESYIGQAEAGLDKEHPKFDFKAKWYDLKQPRDINEFVKDTTSIANTYGPDGFIVIGYDDKAKTFHDTKFKDCGLRDTSEIYGLINKRVDLLFDISIHDIIVLEHSLSVIHIPPSINKPHVIRSHQRFDKTDTVIGTEEHRILVRKGTSAQVATRWDVELMYYDRKNIQPEYEILSSADLTTIVFNTGGGHVAMTVQLTLENTGRRPVSITKIKCTHKVPTEAFQELHFSSLQAAGVIVEVGGIRSARIDLSSNETFNDTDLTVRSRVRTALAQSKSDLNKLTLNLVLSNGTELTSTCVISEMRNL